MPSTNTSTAPIEHTAAREGDARILPITRLYAQICYALLAAGPLFPPFLVIALILNLLRRRRAQDTWLASHFTRQMHDLKISAIAIFLSIVLAMPLWFMGMGMALSRVGESALEVATLPLLIYLVVSVVFMARMIRGWRAMFIDQAV
jgi:uncharacterized membrane protein